MLVSMACVLHVTTPQSHKKDYSNSIINFITPCSIVITTSQDSSRYSCTLEMPLSKRSERSHKFWLISVAAMTLWSRDYLCLNHEHLHHKIIYLASHFPRIASYHVALRYFVLCCTPHVCCWIRSLITHTLIEFVLWMKWPLTSCCI